jgi:tetratricopeptide (TPR) repeat protein
MPLASVLAVVFCAYSNSFHAPFILDNYEIILRDPRVQEVSSTQLHRILTQQYWETATTGLYRPVTTLSYLLNYAILGGGADPSGYHWLNLLLHLTNVALVYLLGIAVFESVPAALLMSALWGLHPVQSEAVTNIVGRADLLVVLSVLSALLCHRQVSRSRGWRSYAWVAGVLVASTVGVFAKENGIVVIALLLAYDAIFTRRSTWIPRLASYLAAALPAAAYLYVRGRVLASAPYLATAFGDNPLLGADFWTARLTALKVIARYFKLLLWPNHLGYDYSYNQVPLFGSSASDGETWLGLALCLAALVGVVWSWRRHKPLCFGIAFFAIAFAPVSNLIILIGTIMAERLLYFPSIGLAICGAYGLASLWKHLELRPPIWRQAALATVGVLLIASVARTYDRNNDWLDQSRFWRSGVEAAPGSYKAHMNVATTDPLLTQEDWDIAIRETSRALQILDPLTDDHSTGRSYRDAAMIYREVGETLADKKPAGSLSAGTTPESWYRKALAAIQRSERIELAFDRHYRDENARRGLPGLSALPALLYLEMGRIYMHLDDAGNALAAFERGRSIESMPALLEEAAEAYARAGDLHNAVIALEESYTVDSKRPVIGKLTQLYTQLDPNGCSVTHDASRAGLNPDCPSVHADICSASHNIEGTYLRRGQPFEAAAVKKRAIDYLSCPAW